jgi:hypothetical protein
MFEAHAQYFGKNYKEIPNIYRNPYEIEITYYPDGTQPENLKTAAPPTNSESNHNIKYHNVELLTYNNKTNHSSDHHSNEFWTTTKFENDAKNHLVKISSMLHLDVMNKPDTTDADLPKTDEGFSISKPSIVTLMVAGFILVAVGGTFAVNKFVLSKIPADEKLLKK